LGPSYWPQFGTAKCHFRPVTESPVTESPVTESPTLLVSTGLRDTKTRGLSPWDDALEIEELDDFRINLSRTAKLLI
jgi:hypothetical protein